jgi:hypothetical protein
LPPNGRAPIRKPRRALQRDALAAKLPMDRRDRRAQFLADDADFWRRRAAGDARREVLS